MAYLIDSSWDGSGENREKRRRAYLKLKIQAQ
jgi:hypothetical protein